MSAPLIAFRLSLIAFRQKDAAQDSVEFSEPPGTTMADFATESEERTANGGFYARRQLTAAHALACYRCFLPDLAGFTRLRCAGPAPDEFQYSIPSQRVRDPDRPRWKMVSPRKLRMDQC